ncbi:MAG TPA: group II intron reverse transcriptase/maturase [Thermoanaerobaculia bacterium]|nr:group II intron reverse transcriptase/maturase [Thermoanaerobaculia bacterium]
MSRAQDLGSVSTRLRAIAEKARRVPGRALVSLNHYIDVYWLHEAHRRTRKDGAVGVDQVTAEEYGRDLEGNLRSLLERLKSGQYRAPSVRRAWIPKSDGSRRPIGIPTFEDKVLQRAIAMVVEAVYEETFEDFSYGFRPSRSAHDALQCLRDGLMEMGGGWVLEVDIQNFFEELDPTHLRSFLDRRVRDGVIRRTIDKWLKAGVLEAEAQVRRRDRGTPQGGVISPLLANIYLHHVVDEWYVEEVRSRLRGTSLMVRYADDLVMAFAHEGDAQRVRAALEKRLARYGLRLHPTKTRIVPFQRPPYRADPDGGDRPGGFDFLGFTHVWERSRKGNWVIRQQTARARQRAILKRLAMWCRKHRHRPVGWQHRQISAALRGHDAYYGITGNARALGRLRHRVERIWQKWLARRSQRGLTWERFCQRILRRFPLPRPRIVHRYAAP